MRTNRGRAARWLIVGLVAGLAGCAAQLSTSAVHVPRVAPSPTPTSVAQPAPVPQPRVRATAAPADPQVVVTAVHSVSPKATVGALVVDRTSGTELLSVNADRQFRSASLVKLLIAVDALSRGAEGRDQKRIAVMLRVSDDDIATSLWVAAGGAELVTRTSARLGLTATRPPGIPGRWGDVLLSAHDVARVYQYVLTELPDQQRELVVAAMAGAPRAAADGFDQHFGIPDGLGGHFAIKQGWSDSTNDIVLHSTGLVGDGWRRIVIVLTEHPLGMSFRTAARSVTAGAKALSPLVQTS